MSARAHRTLPGFGLSLGLTIAYLSLLVLIPLSTIFVKSMGLGWESFWHSATAPRVMASYRVTLLTSLASSVVNGAFGLLVAWVLVRYRFPGRKLLDAMVDLPFALPRDNPWQARQVSGFSPSARRRTARRCSSSHRWCGMR